MIYIFPKCAITKMEHLYLTYDNRTRCLLKFHKCTVKFFKNEILKYVQSLHWKGIPY